MNIIESVLKKPVIHSREMKLLGDRVKYFRSPSPTENREAAAAFLDSHGGQVYTGLHCDNGDWFITSYWEKGWHLVNRTGKYAVVMNTVSFDVRELTDLIFDIIMEVHNATCDIESHVSRQDIHFLLVKKGVIHGKTD